jgi:hypothetical protein
MSDLDIAYPSLSFPDVNAANLAGAHFVPNENSSIASQEARIRQVLSSSRFLEMRGLGNEVPFFIWAYPPTEQLAADGAADRLRKTLTTQNGLTVISIDLFGLAIQLLEQRGVLTRLEQLEPKRSREEFRRDLQKMLDPEKHIVPAIQQSIQEVGEYDILSLTGIGKVFPFIRSHNVLENLQTVAGKKPMLMFYPGEYRQSASTGSELQLFGNLAPDKYYRAKNILEQEP